ncbi:hypothetical protein MN116_006236 [Schistosoma mekongi]|uniref:Uncharacterized protein n=1 Tax=Schistosoma mekongi TaxID=38744 RepID=A0AAE2D424_SCHME|nr:hypothetical protein MN116_006236 [Schistosoma mekongi]
MANLIDLFRNKVTNETWHEKSKLNSLAEDNEQLLHRISKLEGALNSLKSVQPFETTLYELTDKINGSIASEKYSSYYLRNLPDQRTFSPKNLYDNLQAINFDKRLEAMEMKLRSLFHESNISTPTDVLNKYAVKIVTETYHPITSCNQHCTESYRSAKQLPTKMDDCLHLDLKDLGSCNHCLHHSDNSNRTAQTMAVVNNCQHIDKSIQTTCIESTNIIANSISYIQEAEFTNENQVTSKVYTSDALKMNNQFITPTVFPNNNLYVNRVNRLSKEDINDDESISKFTSSECFDMVNLEADALQQNYYNSSKVKLHKTQQFGWNQMRQTHSFEAGLNNEDSCSDNDNIPTSSRSHKQNEIVKSNFDYGPLGPSIHKPRKPSTLESSFETIYDQTKVFYKL